MSGGRVYPPDTLAPSSGTTKVDGTHPTGTLSCYRPQMKFAKVMFLHMSVILFTGGVWYPSMHCRSPGPHPGGKLRGVSRPTPRGEVEGGLQAHTQGGS